jgi:TonB-linked SusC/RagA family outer membrane protein
MKKLLFLFSALFFAGSIFAQGKIISGQVLDSETNDPIIGAAVVVVGATVGTVTDTDGKFTITLPEGTTKLKISLMGYEEEVVIAKNGMTVLMLTDAETLDVVEVEVFVGATKDKGYGGSAQVLGADKIEQKNPSDMTKAMAGEFAGVQVVSSSGQPGTISSIRIRGINTINGGSNPLYVVDGIPYNGDISSIDPSDIASMTVLKDATATALYGARGSNGVVLITTKKGTAGSEGRIDIDLKYGVNMRLIPLYETIDDPKTYTELGWLGLYTNARIVGKSSHTSAANNASAYLFNASGTMGGLHPSYNPFDTEGKFLIDHETGKMRSDVGFLYPGGPEKWSDYIYHTGKKYEATVKFSGGSEKTTYFTSFGFLNDEGYYIQSDLKRFNARSNIDFEPKKWLKGNLNVSYGYTKMNYPGQDDNMNSGFQFVNGMPPIFPVFQHDPVTGEVKKDPNVGGNAYDYGMYEQYGRPFAPGINPAGALQLDKRNQDAHNVVISSRWEVEFYKDLRFITTAGFQYVGYMESDKTNMFYGDAEGVGRISKYGGSVMYVTSAQILKYQKTIKDIHNLDAFVGHSSDYYAGTVFYGQKSQLYNPNDMELSNASVLGDLTSGSSKEMRDSYMGQVRYNYNEKYFFEINGNLDASSKYLRGHRWGKFGSVAASWIITRERFMNDVKSWLTNLKIKASYGAAGNDNLGQFNYTDLYALSVVDQKPSLVWSRKGVEDLTWESSTTLNVGIEAYIKRDRLKLEVEYYNKRVHSMLFPHPVAPSLGYLSVYANDGKIANNGIDWMITSKIIKSRNVELDFRLNGNFNRTMMLALPHEPRFGETRMQIMTGSYAVGHSLDEWYLPQYAGVNQETGEAQWLQYYDANTSDPNANSDYIVDVYKYLHEDTKDGSLLHPNADIKTKTTTNYNQAGYTFTGKRGNPTVYGGFGFDLTAYGFELSATFNYQLGGYGYDAVYAQLMGDGQFGEFAWHKDMLKAWNPLTEYYNTDVPRLTGGNSEYAEYVNYGSDRFLTSNSALQISNVKLAYSFPKKWIKKALLNSLSIWVSGDNLYAFTARKGYFPFAYSYSGGSDRSQYLPLTTFLGGIKLQF